jgi:hypothetical protein
MHLPLDGSLENGIERHGRGMGRIAARSGRPDADLTTKPMMDQFAELLEVCSWAPMELDLYGVRNAAASWHA